MPKKRTDVEIRKMYEEHVNGASYADIAKKYGIGKNTLTRGFKRLRLAPSLIRKPRKHSEEDVKRYHDWYMYNHATIKDTAVHFRISPPSLKTAFDRLGLCRNTVPYKNLFSRYSNGEKLESIAKEYNISTITLLKHFKQLGLTKEKIDIIPALHSEYIESRKSADVIARKYKISKNTLLREFKERGLEILPARRNNEYLSSQVRKIKIMEKTGDDRIAWLKVNGFTLLEPYISLWTEEHKHRQYKLLHSDCGTKFEDDIVTLPKCPKCHVGRISRLELDIGKYINDVLHITVKRTVRNILPGRRELDIICPSHKVAFEINGLYYHHIYNTHITGKDYHVKKTKDSLAYGYRLYHIWESADITIIKSMIRSILGVSEKSVGARKLEAKSLKVTSFFDENHLHGSTPAKWSYGLVDSNGEILCGLSIREFRNPKAIPGVIEIARFATKMGYSVPGGFSKLLKLAIREISPSKIITYADQDWTPDSANNVYVKNGFKLVGETPPKLFYTDTRQIFKREKYQKHKLEDLFPDTYNQNLTANEILEKNGIYPIYATGNWRFEMKLS